MTKQMDDLMQMVEEAGGMTNVLLMGRHDNAVLTTGELERFVQSVAKKAVEDEREACAKVCDDAAEQGDPFNSVVRKALAAAIRARSQRAALDELARIDKELGL